MDVTQAIYQVQDYNTRIVIFILLIIFAYFGSKLKFEEDDFLSKQFLFSVVIWVSRIFLLLSIIFAFVILNPYYNLSKFFELFLSLVQVATTIGYLVSLYFFYDIHVNMYIWIREATKGRFINIFNKFKRAK